MPILFLFVFIYANYNATTKMPQSERLVEWITETSHDFGTIPKGKPVRALFKFKNISNEDLTIDNVRTPCNCTTPDWDENVILAGKTGKIEIIYDAAKDGYFKEKITVWFHGQRKAEKLYIEGETE